jgi:tRNA dimethylallyltransferase
MDIDPEGAGRIDRRNVRRVIRALEVTQHTSIAFSQQQQKNAPDFKVLMIGLTVDRAELYRCIDQRVDRMLEMGLVDEVKRLIQMGYGLYLPPMSGIGYKQIGMYLSGEASLDSAIQQIKYETHRFVRQQYNWFRLDDSRIKWFDIQDNTEGEIRALVSGFIAE